MTAAVSTFFKAADWSANDFLISIFPYINISALLIDEDLTVKPGTPLEMSIELDRLSSDIYGVMVSNMEGGNSMLFSVYCNNSLS